MREFETIKKNPISFVERGFDFEEAKLKLGFREMGEGDCLQISVVIFQARDVKDLHIAKSLVPSLQLRTLSLARPLSP